MTACQKYEESLEAYHDGELSGLGRWRMGRHLRSCRDCRDEVDAFRRIAVLVREDERAAAPHVDLWASIAARLPALDAELEARHAAAVPQHRGRGWSRILGPLPIGVGGLAAAGIAVALWVHTPLPTTDDVVEELDAMGHPVAVLPSDEKSTIIWVLDPKPVASVKESGGEAL